MLENLPLVRLVVGRLWHRRDVREMGADAYQEGRLALVRAAELFDEARGFAFATYAYRCILRRVLRASLEQRLIAVPSGLCGERDQYRAQARRMWCVRARGWDSADDFVAVVDDLAQPAPTDCASVDRADLLEWVFRRLPPKEAGALRLLFLEGLTQQEAAQRLGVSQQRVHELRENAFRRVRLAARRAGW